MVKDMEKSFNTNAVYISYARDPRPEEKHPERKGIADIIEPLAQAVRDAGITCYIDTADIQNGDSISEFEQAIGRAKCVILVFSARYFTRPHCMYEFKQILNGVSSGKIKKLILIKAGVCNFDDLNFVADIHGEWGRIAWKYEMQPKKAIMEYAKKFNYYKDDIKNLPNFFSSNNYDRVENLDIPKLIRQIKPVFDTPQPHTSSFVNEVNVKTQELISPTSTSKLNDKYVLYAALAVMFGIIFWLLIRTPEPKNAPLPVFYDTTTKASDIATEEKDTTTQQPLVDEKIATHDYVDLGLPSGTLWATCNIGANNPWEFGDYFAWGDVKPANENDDTPIIDIVPPETLPPSRDAATANWGSGWCMPTVTQYNELKTKCLWTWRTLNGNDGYEVKGINGNLIFLPAAGRQCTYDEMVIFYEDVGRYGLYWSSSPARPDFAYYLSFSCVNCDTYAIEGFYEYPVRAVRRI